MPIVIKTYIYKNSQKLKEGSKAISEAYRPKSISNSRFTYDISTEMMPGSRFLTMKIDNAL